MTIILSIKRLWILSWPFLLNAFLNDDENFFAIFFGNDIVWNKGYQNIKFNFRSHWRLRKLKELSVVSVCFKTNLYFTNWQFNELLCYPQVNLVHCMCIACDVQNARNQTFYRELLTFENSSQIKKAPKSHKIHTNIFRDIISLIRVFMNLKVDKEGDITDSWWRRTFLTVVKKNHSRERN